MLNEMVQVRRPIFSSTYWKATAFQRVVMTNDLVASGCIRWKPGLRRDFNQ
jgi:hypothetical protein